MQTVLIVTYIVSVLVGLFCTFGVPYLCKEALRLDNMLTGIVVSLFPLVNTAVITIVVWTIVWKLLMDSVDWEKVVLDFREK